MDYVKRVVEKLQVCLFCFWLTKSSRDKQKKRIYLRFKPNRQTAVFSRLVPSGIQRQGDEFVRNCIFFEMHHDKESVGDEVKQIIEIIDKNLKISR